MEMPPNGKVFRDNVLTDKKNQPQHKVLTVFI
jgi:hypothetical protein